MIGLERADHGLPANKTASRNADSFVFYFV